MMRPQWGDGSRWVIRRITDVFGTSLYWVLPPRFKSGPVRGFTTFEAARAAFAAGGVA